MIVYGPSGGDKGIEKSKFKNWNFSIPIADSDSLQKNVNVKNSRQESNDDNLFANLDILFYFSRDNI